MEQNNPWFKSSIIFLLLATGGNTSMAFTLTSPAFNHMEMVPSMYTCEGRNISPPLAWKEIPSQTKSLALIMDDPDAPSGTWVHWVLYGIPVTQSSLEEGTSANGTIKEGKNSWGHAKYEGPCPPSGTHRYVFTLYAVDILLDNNISDKNSLIERIKNHILEKAVLIGQYQKNT